MLCSLSGSAVRSHPFSVLEQTFTGAAFLRSRLWILLFHLCSFFFSLPIPPPFCKWVIARLLSFYPQSLVPSALPALLALFCGCSGWAGWEAPDWLQAVPLPGLTSRHCFCPLNRINKSMCQVDCSQETMTQFWHHCPPHLSPSPPPSASLQLLIKKTLLSWLYALPWGCLAALFSFFFFFYKELGVGAKM